MTRLLVAREIHDEVVDRLVAGLEALTMGDPANLDTTWGPLAAPRFLDRAENYIERAVAGGATIATGGARPSGLEGYFLEPTLLTNVNNDMEAAQNEIFGPVFCVIPFDNLDEAVAIANDSRYGLSGSCSPPTSRPASTSHVACAPVSLSSTAHSRASQRPSGE